MHIGALAVSAAALLTSPASRFSCQILSIGLQQWVKQHKGQERNEQTVHGMYKVLKELERDRADL